MAARLFSQRRHPVHLGPYAVAIVQRSGAA